MGPEDRLLPFADFRNSLCEGALSVKIRPDNYCIGENIPNKPKGSRSNNRNNKNKKDKDNSDDNSEMTTFIQCVRCVRLLHHFFYSVQ